MIISGLDRVENIVEKGEIAWQQAISPLPTMISNVFFLHVTKGVIVWAWVKA